MDVEPSAPKGSGSLPRIVGTDRRLETLFRAVVPSLRIVHVGSAVVTRARLQAGQRDVVASQASLGRGKLRAISE